jgi:hypothetical protein
MSCQDPSRQEENAICICSVSCGIVHFIEIDLNATKIFQEVEDARIAIRDSVGMIIDGRKIRAEHAKVDRELASYLQLKCVLTSVKALFCSPATLADQSPTRKLVECLNALVPSRRLARFR